jgi:hypothetical protein
MCLRLTSEWAWAQRRQQPVATSNGCQSLSTSRCASAKQALHACDCGKTLRQDPGHQKRIAQPEDHASACRSSENLSLLLHAVQMDSHSKKFLAPIYRSHCPDHCPAECQRNEIRLKSDCDTRPIERARRGQRALWRAERSRPQVEAQLYLPVHMCRMPRQL